MKIIALAAILLSSTAAIAAEPKTNNPAELKKIIAQQEEEIASLKKQLAEIEPASGQKEEPALNNKLIKNKLQYNKE